MKQLPNEAFFEWVEEELSQDRPVTFRVRGNSMFPLLKDGKDSVMLYPCVGEELRVMDVVLFKYKGRHVMHRIVSIDGDKLSMQGDGLPMTYEHCLRGDVLGRVGFVIKSSGKKLDVHSKKWMWPSALWCRMGVMRRYFLRIWRYIDRHI